MAAENCVEIIGAARRLALALWVTSGKDQQFKVILPPENYDQVLNTLREEFDLQSGQGAFRVGDILFMRDSAQ